MRAPNLMLRVGDKYDLWGKVMKEVEAKRYAGPYQEIPFEHFIQSPIGLVPKDKGTKTRLIFHLSYPKNSGKSVNANIPKDLCTVRYPDFTEAVRMCLQAGVNAQIGKSDMSMAFRHVPMQVKDFCFLILKAKHPRTDRTFYFVDKCLSFGSSISCACFQSVSDCIAHIVSSKTGRVVLNYLDDYFFADVTNKGCNWQVNQFLWVCKQNQVPSLT